MKRNSSVTIHPLSDAPVGQIHTYAELQRQIHYDLRVQHPEWVEPNGDSPICDQYDRRLAELVAFFQSTDPHSIAA